MNCHVSGHFTTSAPQIDKDPLLRKRGVKKYSRKEESPIPCMNADTERDFVVFDYIRECELFLNILVVKRTVDFLLFVRLNWSKES